MPRVIVVGGANVDIKGRASSDLIAHTSNPGEVTVTVGGVGRNIAENLARLDIETSLATFVGDDSNGRRIRESCSAAGIGTAMVETGNQPTGVYLAVLDRNGEMTVAVNDMRAADLMTVDYLQGRSHRLAAAGMLVADCNLPADCLSWLCHFASEIRVPLLIEPISVPKARKLLGFNRSPPVFAITPNLQQLESLTAETNTMTAIVKLHRLGFANIVVHCGSDGAIVSDGVEPPRRVPALDVEDVADVTGAGDAAVAGLICGLVSGHDLLASARLGQASAAIKLRSRKSVASGITRGSVFALAGLAEDN